MSDSARTLESQLRLAVAEDAGAQDAVAQDVIAASAVTVVPELLRARIARVDLRLELRALAQREDGAARVRHQPLMDAARAKPGTRAPRGCVRSLDH